MHRLRFLIATTGLGLVLFAAAATAQDVPKRAAAMPAATGFPMLFEANRGQADPKVKFLARGFGQALFLTEREATVVLALPSSRADQAAARTRPEAIDALALRIAFAGASSKVRLDGRVPSKTMINRQVGRDRAQWQTDVPTYEQTIHRGLYPGIDLVFRPGATGLAYDFHVAPGANPKTIRLSFPAAERLALDAAGDLVIRIAGHEVRQTAPVLYQEVAGRRESVSGSYVLRGPTEVGFLVGRYDRKRPLVIDPTIVVGTLYGGSGIDLAFWSGYADGPNGEVFVAGWTPSPDLYVAGSTQAQLRGTGDAFIAKFDADTLDVVYATYFGGDASDSANGITVGPDGRAYVVGGTYSNPFPLSADAKQTTPTGAFFARLSPSGQVEYSSYFGGSGLTQANTVALLGNRVIVGGSTRDPAFATVPLAPGAAAPSTRGSGQYDAYIARLDATTGEFVDAGYFGGSRVDSILKIVADAATGQVSGIGQTDSPDLLPVAPVPESFGGGLKDSVVFRLNAAGDALSYLNFIGGSFEDEAHGIAVDGAGNAHVVGTTSSSNIQQIAPFPDQGPPQSSITGYYAVIDPSGRFVRRAYLGSVVGNTELHAVAVDPTSGKILIGGRSTAPPPSPAAENAITGSADGFIGSIVPAGAGPDVLGAWTFIGGSSSSETVMHVAARPNGAIIAAGQSYSSDFAATPVVSQRGPGGILDVFVVRLGGPPPVGVPNLLVTIEAVDATSRQTLTGAIYSSQHVGFRATVRNIGLAPAVDVTASMPIDAGCTFVDPAIPGPGGTASFAQASPLQPGDRAIFDITIRCDVGPRRVDVGVASTNEPAPQAADANAAHANIFVFGPPNLFVTIDALDLVHHLPLSQDLYADDPMLLVATVRNIGTSPAEAVRIDSTVSAGCTNLDPQGPTPGSTMTSVLPNPLAPSGMPGDSARVLFIYVKCAAGTQRNTISVSATNEPATQAADGNQARVNVDFGQRPVLLVETVLDSDALRVGAIGRFGIRLRNTGPVTATNPRVIVTFDGGDRVQLFDRSVPPWATCQPTTTTPTGMRTDCTMRDLAPGQALMVLELSGFLLAAGQVQLTGAAEAEGARATASTAGGTIRP